MDIIAKHLHMPSMLKVVNPSVGMGGPKLPTTMVWNKFMDMTVPALMAHSIPRTLFDYAIQFDMLFFQTWCVLFNLGDGQILVHVVFMLPLLDQRSGK
jgi:hypothetical protein